MSRLLLVDDETAIIKGLRKLVDYEALGIEIVGEAANGRQALEMTLDLVPDIVMTDIWMPVMDGIEYMRLVSEKNLPVKVIVLSGYSEFSYAKQAMRYGASDYLLKPVEAEDLAETLQKIVSQLLDERNKERCLETAQRHLTDNLSLVREHFLRRLLMEKTSLSKARESAELLGLSLPDGGCSVLILRLDEIYHNPAFQTEDDRKLLLYALYNIADEITEHGLCVTYGRDVCLIQPSVDGDSIWELGLLIRDTFTRYLLEPLEVAAGKTVSNVGEIVLSYQSALEALGDGRGGHVNVRVKNAACEKIKHFIAANYHEELSLRDIAASVYMNPSYVSSLFKKHFGESLTDYILRIRMENAARLLLTTDQKTYEAAEAVGFKNVRYFNYAFKNFYGFTPTEFRKISKK